MLRRQKILLSVLHNAGREVAPIELVKLAFLIRHETTMADDTAFYDFVPYKYGPFSFSLYRELEGLQNNGYIEITDNSVVLCKQTHSESLAKVRELSSHELGTVATIVRKYSKQSSRTLIRDVYSRYPWFTINSELSELIAGRRPKRPEAPIAIYTSGYEGKSVDQFFDILLNTGIKRLIDVRFNPMSRKYGFAGSSLRRIGDKLGITYMHVPELGISGEHRESLDDFDSYQKLLDRYSTFFLKQHETALQSLVQRIEEVPSVLVCMEKDVRCCHRSRLADELARRTELPIVHV